MATSRRSTSSGRFGGFHFASNRPRQANSDGFQPQGAFAHRHCYSSRRGLPRSDRRHARRGIAQRLGSARSVPAGGGPRGDHRGRRAAELREVERAAAAAGLLRRRHRRRQQSRWQEQQQQQRRRRQ